MSQERLQRRLDDIQLAVICQPEAEAAFQAWWASDGLLLSQRISVALGLIGIQDIIKTIWFEGYLSALRDRAVTPEAPKTMETSGDEPIDPFQQLL